MILNKHNPLTKGMISCWIPKFRNTGGIIKDLSGYYNDVILNNGVSWETSIKGIGCKFSTDYGTSINAGLISNNYSVSGFTLLFYGNLDGVVNSIGGLISNSVGSTVNNAGIDFIYNGFTKQLYISMANYVAFNYIQSVALANNGWALWAARCTNGTLNLLCNGIVLQIGTAQPYTQIAPTSNSTYWSVGMARSGYLLNGAKLGMAAIYNRVLSNVELKKISNNPYALFVGPQIQKIIKPPIVTYQRSVLCQQSKINKSFSLSYKE